MQTGEWGQMFRFLGTPLFLALAIINYGEAVYLCVIPGAFGFLGSMWFMYLLMALVHLDCWVNWFMRPMRGSAKRN